MSRQPRRSARNLFALTTLVLEAFVVLFAALVAYGLQLVAPALLVAISTGIALLALTAAGLVRRGTIGYALGWVVQALLIAAGFVVPMMFAVGGIFALLWFASLRIGAQIDTERVAREEAEEAYAAAQAG